VDVSVGREGSDIDRLRKQLEPAVERRLERERRGGVPQPAPAVLSLGRWLDRGSRVGANASELVPQVDLLFGAGQDDAPSMQPLVVAEDTPLACHTAELLSSASRGKIVPRPECLASARNNPLEGFGPAFVVWPLTAAHVEVAVRFAARHRLCVAVIGSGSDFANRHSCPNGLYIRTSLMKARAWRTDRDSGGLATFGAGVNCGEAQYYTSFNHQYVSCAWTASIGLAGWMFSGGHGPFAPSLGLGADNLVGAEVVLPNGTLAEVNSSHHPELFWAMRGGGGGLWGVATSVTIRTHRLPSDGFTFATASLSGNLCAAGMRELNRTIDAYASWVTGIGIEIAGYAIISTDRLRVEEKSSQNDCGAQWSFVLGGVWYAGNTSVGSHAWQSFWASAPTQGGTPRASGIKFSETRSMHSTWWDAMMAPQMSDAERGPYAKMPFGDGAATAAINVGAIAAYPYSAHGAGPSVLVPRDVVVDGRFGAAIKDHVSQAATGDNKRGITVRLFHDLAGHLRSENSLLTSDSGSAYEKMSTALVHLMFSDDDGPIGTRARQHYCALSKFSFQPEAEYGQGCHMSLSRPDIPNVNFGDADVRDREVGMSTSQQWQRRFWGSDAYSRLLAVKRQLDPMQTFWCQYCVGDEEIDVGQRRAPPGYASGVLFTLVILQAAAMVCCFGMACCCCWQPASDGVKATPRGSALQPISEERSQVMHGLSKKGIAELEMISTKSNFPPNSLSMLGSNATEAARLSPVQLPAIRLPPQSAFHLLVGNRVRGACEQRSHGV